MTRAPPLVHGTGRRRAKRDGESFSDVVMRAAWEDLPATGEELASLVRERGALYDDDELATVEATKTEKARDRDKWAEE